MLGNRYYKMNQPTPDVATFDERNHCDNEGWATWQSRPMFRFRFRCWLGLHAWPLRTPIPANGFSPSNYDRCTRCHAFVHWFVDGQHRYGYQKRIIAAIGEATDELRWLNEVAKRRRREIANGTWPKEIT